MQRRAGHSKPTHFNIAQAAKMAGVTEALLTLWVETGHFEPSIEVPPLPPPDRSHPRYEVLSRHREDFPKTYGKAFVFTQADIERLRKMVEKASTKPPIDKVWTDDGKQENFTVAQVASMWKLSPDTIQRLFQDEPGVVKLSSANTRGKRPRNTLRIPREVMNRVKRKLANK
jgi:hypothetical protein